MVPRRLSILLVADDDGEDVRRTLERIAAKDSVHVVHTPQAALELLRTERIPSTRRLVLVDLPAPLELVRSLRADVVLRKTPVIVLAREARPAADAHQLHVAGYVKKPNDAAELAETLWTIHQYWSSMELV